MGSTKGSHLPFLLDGLRRAAVERGVAFKVDAEFGQIAQLTYPNGLVRHARSTMLDINNAGSSMLADAKSPSFLLLRDAGIPIPVFRRFIRRAKLRPQDLLANARIYAVDIGFPVIVRAAESGVRLGGSVCRNGAELTKAIEKALQRTRKVLVQRWIDGEPYRFCFLRDEVVLKPAQAPSSAVDLALAAARLSGLDFCSVDVVVPGDASGAQVVKVDSSPDLAAFAAIGPDEAVAVEKLFGRLIEDMGRPPQVVPQEALPARAADAARGPLWKSLYQRFSQLTSADTARFETIRALRRIGRLRYPHGKVRHLYAQHCDINRRASFYLANVKAWSLEFLREGGFHVPRSGWFFADWWAMEIGSSRNETAALQYARGLGFPVVVKPNSDSFGRGVHVVSNEETFLHTVRSILAREPSFLVQELIAGVEYRVVVLDDQVYYILEKQALAVVGDGVRTIQELLEAHLASLVAQRGRAFVATRANDTRINSYLEYAGRTREDVPSPGERVQLVLNARGGGYGVLAADAVPAPVLAAAVEMTRYSGLRYCGLDLKIPVGPNAPPYCVLELNPSPDLRGYASLGGERREAVERLVLTIVDAMGREPLESQPPSTRKAGAERVRSSIAADPMGYKPRFRIMVGGGTTVPVTISGAVNVMGLPSAGLTVSYVITDELGHVLPGGSIPLNKDGSYSITVPLIPGRGRRRKRGRTYTVTVTAQDSVGNSGQSKTVVTVRE